MAELIPILETAPAGYRSNAAGHLVPEAKIDDIDKDRDELVRGFVARAQALHLSLSRFKRDALGDVDAFVSLVAEKYGASVGGAKGNVTLMSYDGRFKLQVQVAERLEFDERLQVAKTLVDKCIHRSRARPATCASISASATATSTSRSRWTWRRSAWEVRDASARIP